MGSIGTLALRAMSRAPLPNSSMVFRVESLSASTTRRSTGLPDGRLIQAGDLVQLDVTFEKNGYMTDTAATIAVEPVTDPARGLDGLRRTRFPAGHVRGARIPPG